MRTFDGVFEKRNELKIKTPTPRHDISRIGSCATSTASRDTTTRATTTNDALQNDDDDDDDNDKHQ